MRKSVVVTVVVGGAALCQLILFVLLGRWLPEADFGLFALVYALVSVTSSIALMGQMSALARFLSREGLARHDWPHTLRRAVALALGPQLVLALLASLFYSLPAAATLVVALAGGLFLVTQLAASGVARQGDRFVSGMVSLRLAPIALLVLVLAGHGLGWLDLQWVYGLFVASAMAASGLALGVAIRGLPRGTTPIPRSFWRQAAWFWVISLCLAATRNLDRLVLGHELPLGALGTYQAALTAVGTFDLLMVALSFVLLPVLTRLPRVPVGKLLGLLIGIGAALAVPHVWFARPLIEVAYGGRYLDGIALIPLLVAAGILKVAYVLPSTLLGGRLPQRALAAFAVLNLALLVANTAVLWILSRMFGLVGAAWGVVIAWTLRLILGLGMVMIHGGSGAGRPAETQTLERPA